MPVSVGHARRRARNPGAGITEVRPLTTADLARLAEPAPPTDVTRIRDVHHSIALAFAMGKSNTEIAEEYGFTANRISTLRHAPAMIELTANYRAMREESRRAAIDEFERNAAMNMRKGERILETYLDNISESETPPDLSTARFIERLATNRMDRFGYGKQTTNLNVNVDFAKKLEAAIARSGKVIDHDS